MSNAGFENPPDGERVDITSNVELRPAGIDDLEHAQPTSDSKSAAFRRVPTSKASFITRARSTIRSVGISRTDFGLSLTSLQQAVQTLESTERHGCGFNAYGSCRKLRDGLDQPLLQASRRQLDLYPL